MRQDVADVGSVVWDAEVLLAHYLDLAYGVRLRGMRVLELGAGTGLAGIVRGHIPNTSTGTRHTFAILTVET